MCARVRGETAWTCSRSYVSASLHIWKASASLHIWKATLGCFGWRGEHSHSLQRFRKVGHSRVWSGHKDWPFLKPEMEIFFHLQLT